MRKAAAQPARNVKVRASRPVPAVLLYAVARRTADQFPAPATARLAGFNVIGGPAKSVLASWSMARRWKAGTSVLWSWLIALRCTSYSLRTSACALCLGIDGAWLLLEL